MRRTRAALAMCALVLCTGCAVAMPNTAQVIAPRGFDDLWIAVGADIESWFTYLSLFLGL